MKIKTNNVLVLLSLLYFIVSISPTGLGTIFGIKVLLQSYNDRHKIESTHVHYSAGTCQHVTECNNVAR